MLSVNMAGDMSHWQPNPENTWPTIPCLTNPGHVPAGKDVCKVAWELTKALCFAKEEMKRSHTP